MKIKEAVEEILRNTPGLKLPNICPWTISVVDEFGSVYIKIQVPGATFTPPPEKH